MVVAVAVLVFESEEINHIYEEVLRDIDSDKEEQGHVHVFAVVKAGDHNERDNCKY